MKITRLAIFIALFANLPSMAQVYSNKVVGAKNESLKDSLENSEYPYILPIWGDKVTKRGYQLPYSAGVGINYLWQESALIISDLSVGFNDSEMYNLNEVIRFNEATASANAINVRPDIWLFPFLNIYGILASAKTSTAIDAGIFVPDSTNTWHEVSSFSTKANFNATTLGFGITPTMGVGGGWMALDFNMAWSDVSALDKPVFTTIFGPRFGKTFKFKKPDSNAAIWVGGFRVSFSSDTEGTVYVADLVEEGGGDLQNSVDTGLANLEQSQADVDDWWNNLSPVEQANPINEAKYETANNAIDKASNLLVGLDGALSTVESSSISYSLEKDLKDKWNFIVGSQYQFNRHFMVRAEFGFLGSRTQFLGGLQYRFGL